MRSLIILLSLVVFFLTGLIVGIDRGHQDQGNDRFQTGEKVISNEKQQIVVEKDGARPNTPQKDGARPERPDQFTHKAASFLESSVKSIYELIVEAAYSFVKVLFDD